MLVSGDMLRKKFANALLTSKRDRVASTPYQELIATTRAYQKAQRDFIKAKADLQQAFEAMENARKLCTHQHPGGRSAIDIPLELRMAGLDFGTNAPAQCFLCGARFKNLAEALKPVKES